MEISEKIPKSVLNKGSGYLSGYSHTLNPYGGCAFGCSYCYVRQMPVALFRGKSWGTWVEIKREAASVLRRQLRLAKRSGPVTIFMSSSTDPYQPAEYRARVTRSLLEVLAADPPAFLLVQTRSPLVCRDIDLLQQLGNNVRVSMTIETDREDVRRMFAPYSPPIAGRLRALFRLSSAGIPVQVAVAPVLPCSDRFAETLRQYADRVCLDDYFMGDGSGGKRTERLNLQPRYDQLGLADWYHPDALVRVAEQFQAHFSPDRLFVGQAGFAP